MATVFGFGWYKAWENERYHLAVARWNDAQAERAAQTKAELNRVQGLLRSLHGKSDSQKTLEQEINQGEPFDLQNEGDWEVGSWHDPVYDFHSRLTFKGGVLIGYGFSGGYGSGGKLQFRDGWPVGSWSTRKDGRFAQLNTPPPAPWNKSSEKWRQWIEWAGVRIWLIVLVSWFVVARGRLIAAQVLLAAALASGMAWTVNPAYSITWQGIFSNDYLFFALVMLLVSIVILALTLSAAYSYKSALRLQFGVRHALIAVTVVAILLAAGPFGYLTLVVGILGIALFAAVFFDNRTHRPTTLRWMAKRDYFRP